MQTESPNRPAPRRIVAVAKALATAVLSLALGVALCLGLLLGGTALAAG
jgi:4-hydroxybenzoate polyprenyltransferase